MKNALVILGVLSVVLMGAWGICTIPGHTASMPASAIGFGNGHYAPTDTTVQDGLLRSLLGGSSFVLVAEEEEEEIQTDIKEEELTPGPDRTWCCQYA
jgi:hypothetical protein